MAMRPHRFTLFELLVVLGVLVVLGIMVWISVGDREEYRRVGCTSRFRTIGLSGLMYSGDYGGFFPNLNSRDLGSGGERFGNWQPLGSMQYIGDTDNAVWLCPSVRKVKSDADCSNYRYIGSGLRDDNDDATLVTLGYDASGNHPRNAWMSALFIDGHAEGFRPDGSQTVTIIETLPDKSTRTSVSSWNRNDW